jgi:uncharacterized protein YndB with AHSA1/START domain
MAPKTERVRNLTQRVTIHASPHAVYTALVDPKEHATFTGEPAKMVARPGGHFTAYGKGLEGYVLELIQDQRIVLAWRATGWPKSHWSIAQFVLTKAGKSTKVEFSQFGVPLSDWNGIVTGWKQFYWAPLKTYLEA